MMAGKLILPALVVAFLLSATLWAIAALHFYWGAGGIWPAKDERELARSVVGAPGLSRMPPPLACNLVALALAGLGVLPFLLVGVVPAVIPSGVLLIIGFGAALVFLARGYAAYRPEFRRLFPEEPFATRDRRFYAPLCFVIGFSFIFLILAG